MRQRLYNLGTENKFLGTINDDLNSGGIWFTDTSIFGNVTKYESRQALYDAFSEHYNSLFFADVDPPKLIGMKIEDAREFLHQAGFQSRISRVDDNWCVLTMDLKPNRFNLQVDGGIVTSITMG